MATFSDCKVGDRVWSIQNGWGEITNIERNPNYPLAVKFPDYNEKMFNLDGKWLEADSFQTLFWDEVKIVAPERPKKHRHDFCVSVFNSRSEIFAYACRCGDRIMEKEKCWSCEFLKSNCYSETLEYLLNQHHTCEKNDTIPRGVEQ